MKITNLMLAGGLLGWSIAATALAQNVATQDSTSAPSTKQVAFVYDNYLDYVDDNANAVQGAAPATASDTQFMTEPPAEESAPTAWTIPQPNVLKERNIVIGGWAEGGIYGNQYGQSSTNGGGGNGPIGMRTLSNSFDLNQMWFFAERKTETQGCGWDIGGRVDYLIGTDALNTNAFGDHTWDYNWRMNGGWYGSAMPQMYAEVAYNDLRVKVGRFYTPTGYEVVPATQNFFYSHSYAMYYAEPFTHTGALATYKQNDKVTYYGGWVNGWDEGWDTANHGSMFLGGIGYTFKPDVTLTWIMSAGKIGDGTAYVGAANGDVYMNSIVFNCKLNDNWTYVFQHDLGSNYNNGANDAQWYSISNYLFRKLNDHWSAGGRLEWFQDPQGARVIAGNDGNYYELTGGLNYKPNANLTIRPELRYDWYNGAAGPNGQPFNNGAASTQLSGGIDVIFTF